MNDIIIDAGGWKADSVKKLRAKFGNLPIHVFEPNPLISSYYKDIPDCTLHQKAVWIEDTTLKFYYGERHEGRSGSLIHGKTSTTEEYTEVTAVNFDKWIRDTFLPEDNLILKMDIEGAEYQVLPHMVDSGSMNYIKTLMVEWHWDRLPNMTLKQHNEVMSKVNRRILPWV